MNFAIDLFQDADYRFEVQFDDDEVPPLTVDEHPPLGANAGPSPSRVLATAVAHCLSASLLFSLRKFGNDPGRLRTRATVTMARNERGRLRIGRIAVDVRLGVAADSLVRLDRALGQFEDFCIVTQSVRAGVPVDVRVVDASGVVLHGAQPALETA
jgi:organic hydroperoxide reductase OsmC/OhrA